MDVLTRITALLGKSEGTDNPHERDAYLDKAQQLATLHAVDLAVARATTRTQSRPERPEKRHVPIGAYRKHANSHLIRLYSAIARSNDVMIDIVSDSTAVRAYGMPSDLDNVAAIFGSLAHQMVQAGNLHVASRQWEGQVSIRPDGWPSVTNARRARADFYVGFTVRIGERLAQARQQAERSAASVVVPATASELATTGAILLRSRAGEVRNFHARTSSARGKWTGGRTGYSESTESGRAAATRARLGSPRALAG
jgi:hypothetical protein